MTAAPDPVDTALSPWALALRVIDEPAAVFAQLAARPAVLVPILGVIVGMAVVAFGAPDSTFRRQVEQRIEIMEERAPDRLTDERRAELLENAASPSSRAVVFGGGVAVTLVGHFVLTAGVLLLIFNAYGSAPLTYKHELAVAGHAFMPQVLGMLLTIALARFAGMEDLQLSLGFLFDRESSPFLYNVGVQFTLFGAWNMFLLAVGNQVLTKTKTLSGPLMIVAGIWAVVNVLLGALTAFAGGLAG